MGLLLQHRHYTIHGKANRNARLVKDEKGCFPLLPLVLARFGCELYEELIVLCEILFCRRDLRRFLTERSRQQ